MSELSIHELEAQHSEVLPEREALGVAFGSFNNHNSIHAFNQANSFAALGGHSSATAVQTIITG